MEYGLGIPTRGPLAGRESINAIATRAEALGVSWLAVSDHLLTGGASALVDDIGTRADIGVGQVLLNFQRADLERSLESMQRFADEVMAKT